MCPDHPTAPTRPVPKAPGSCLPSPGTAGKPPGWVQHPFRGSFRAAIVTGITKGYHVSPLPPPGPSSPSCHAYHLAHRCHHKATLPGRTPAHILAPRTCRAEATWRAPGQDHPRGFTTPTITITTFHHTATVKQWDVTTASELGVLTSCKEEMVHREHLSRISPLPAPSRSEQIIKSVGCHGLAALCRTRGWAGSSLGALGPRYRGLGCGDSWPILQKGKLRL